MKLELKGCALVALAVVVTVWCAYAGVEKLLTVAGVW